MALNDFRLERDHVLRVALQILHTKQHKMIHSAFESHVPGHAVGGEIAALLSTIDKRKRRLRCLCGDVDVSHRRSKGDAVGIVSSDRLLGITAECVNVEWNGIVKDTDAAANHRLPSVGSPFETGARSSASRVGNGLSF